jgi:hypothetical protein
MVVVALAIAVTLWLGAAKTLSAARHDTEPATRNATTSTEVLRVQYQEVQIDNGVDMHDGGVWEQQSSGSQGG